MLDKVAGPLRVNVGPYHVGSVTDMVIIDCCLKPRDQGQIEERFCGEDSDGPRKWQGIRAKAEKRAGWQGDIDKRNINTLALTPATPDQSPPPPPPPLSLSLFAFTLAGSDLPCLSLPLFASSLSLLLCFYLSLPSKEFERKRVKLSLLCCHSCIRSPPTISWQYFVRSAWEKTSELVKKDRSSRGKGEGGGGGKGGEEVGCGGRRWRVWAGEWRKGRRRMKGEKKITWATNLVSRFLAFTWRAIS